MGDSDLLASRYSRWRRACATDYSDGESTFCHNARVTSTEMRGLRIDIEAVFLGVYLVSEHESREPSARASSHEPTPSWAGRGKTTGTGRPAVRTPERVMVATTEPRSDRPIQERASFDSVRYGSVWEDADIL